MISCHSFVQNPAATLPFTPKSSQWLTRHPPLLPLWKPLLQPFPPGTFFLWLTPFPPSSQLRSHFLKEAYLDPLPHSCDSDPIYPAFTPCTLYLAFLPYAIIYLLILFVYYLAPFSRITDSMRTHQGPRRSARCTVGAQEIFVECMNELIEQIRHWNDLYSSEQSQAPWFTFSRWGNWSSDRLSILSK